MRSYFTLVLQKGMKNPSATQYCQLFYCLDSYKHFPVQKMCLFPIYQRVYLLYFSLPLFQKNQKTNQHTLTVSYI